jgi:YVTN family beta-propeller protein
VFDDDQGVLLAGGHGHGTNYLLAFDVSALNEQPRKSEVEVGDVQSFAFNPEERELYVLNQDTKSLLILDATTLSVIGEVSDLEISPEDVFVAWDKSTGQILVVSETEEDGHPTAVIDRARGTVLYYGDLSTWTLLGDPSTLRVYMAVDDPPHVVAYDLGLRKVVAHGDSSHRYLERMAITSDRSELLVAAPVDASVLRLDLKTLKEKGTIPATLGVRALAVDQKRNVLLTGSLFSNMVQIINLDTHLTVAEFYVGPWLRTIAVDGKAGVAYISSIEGIYRVDYGGRLNFGAPRIVP